MTTRQRVAVGAGAAIIVLLALGLAASDRDRRQATLATADSGLTASVAIEAFRVGDPAPRAWTSAAFAESLAARLAWMPGLTVRRAGGTFGANPDFTVRGEATARDGRLVITARLFRHTGDDAVWTATFWRSDSLTSDLVSDIAGALAEALYGQLARNTVTAPGALP